MVCHENIGMICFMIMKSNVLITIEPCKCSGISILLLMEDVDLHYAKALFNPYLLNEVHLHDDANAREVLNHMLKKNTSSPTTNFVENQRPFLTPPVNDLNLLPHERWDFIRVGGCTFTPIVHCILVQDCCASLCERNLISYSFVHSKVRNQLISKRVKNLVYIHQLYAPPN
jgi:hypothetical protein